MTKQEIAILVLLVVIIGAISYRACQNEMSGRYIIETCGEHYRLQSKGTASWAEDYRIQELNYGSEGESYWTVEETFRTRDGALRRCAALRGDRPATQNNTYNVNTQGGDIGEVHNH